MERTLFKPEHDLFRQNFRKFLEKEVVPHYEEYEDAGMVSRDVWKKAGKQGYLVPWMPEEFGGAGADWLYSVVLIEEVGRANVAGFGLSLHNDVVAPYLVDWLKPELKKQVLPGLLTGDKILAVGMTEPGYGSNLAGIQTTARKDGDDYVISGQKTFITNGQLCDWVVIAAKTNPDANPPYKGISLFLVDTSLPGFRKGRNLKKIGLKANDTSELFLEDVRVPRSHLLGEENKGFYQLMTKLQQERLVVAVRCMANMASAVDHTVKYVKEREVFGAPLGKMQNTQFVLAECATQVEVGQAFVDRLIEAHIAGKDVVKEVSMAKYWVTDTLKTVVDRCLQLHGGYGYMTEYPIARMYTDARVQSIFAGTNEVMKVIIARKLGLE